MKTVYCWLAANGTIVGLAVLGAFLTPPKPDAASPTSLILVLVCLIFGYWLPWLIAKARSHHNSLPIFWVNFALGWTVVGWFVSFIWSLTSPAPLRVQAAGNPV
jgi:hypothetical protein